MAEMNKTKVTAEYIMLLAHRNRPDEPAMTMLNHPTILLDHPVIKGMLPVVTDRLPNDVKYIRIDEIKALGFKKGDLESMALVAEAFDWAVPSAD